MKRNVFLAAALACLFAQCRTAEPVMSPTLSDRDDRVRAYLEGMVRNGDYPGLQYAVYDVRNEVFSCAAGYSDVGLKIPMTLDATGALFSMTKIVTAAALVQLSEKGLCGLDDPVSRYLPGRPWDTMTIRELLTHSSGLGNPVWGNFYVHWSEEDASFDRNEEFRRVVAAHPKLEYEAGSGLLYTNFGYAILGMLIEALSGTSYEDYVRANILEPLGIPESELEFKGKARDGMATPYYRAGDLFYEFLARFALRGNTTARQGNWQAIRRDFIIDFPGHGGLTGSLKGWSTVIRDLVSPHPALISRAGRDAMLSIQATAGGKKIYGELARLDGKRFPARFRGLGLAWQALENGDGVAYYKHGGGGLGFISQTRFYPEAGIVTMFLSNCTDATLLDRRDMDNLDAEFLRR